MRYVEGILQQRILDIWNVTLDKDLPSTELDFTWKICYARPGVSKRHTVIKVWSSWNIRGCMARIFPWARDCSSFLVPRLVSCFSFPFVISRRCHQIPG